MQPAIVLIDKASEVCGSDTALAKRLKISKSLLSMMRSGHRAMTPGIAVELADIAGMNAHDAMTLAVIEGEKVEARRVLLVEILGKGLAAGGAALLGSSYRKGLGTSAKNEPDEFTNSSPKVNSLYIVSIRQVYWRLVWKARALMAIVRGIECNAVMQPM